MGVSDEALGVIPGRTASSADLGGKWREKARVYRNVYANLYSLQVVANIQMRTLKTEVGKGSM